MQCTGYVFKGTRSPSKRTKPSPGRHFQLPSMPASCSAHGQHTHGHSFTTAGILPCLNLSRLEAFLFTCNSQTINQRALKNSRYVFHFCQNCLSLQTAGQRPVDLICPRSSCCQAQNLFQAHRMIPMCSMDKGSICLPNVVV